MLFRLNCWASAFRSALPLCSSHLQQKVFTLFLFLWQRECGCAEGFGKKQRYSAQQQHTVTVACWASLGGSHERGADVVGDDFVLGVGQVELCGGRETREGHVEHRGCWSRRRAGMLPGQQHVVVPGQC